MYQPNQFGFVQSTHILKNDAVFEAGLGWAGRNSIAESHQQTEEENGKQREEGRVVRDRVGCPRI